MQPRLQYLSRLSAVILFAIVFFIFFYTGPRLETSLAAGPQVPDDYIIQFVGRYDGGNESAIAVAVQGEYAYVGYERQGQHLMGIVDVSKPAQPVWMGEISFPVQIWDIKISGDFAYIANDSNGLRIIYISDPTAPREVGRIDNASATYGVAIAGDYAYIAGGDNGLSVVNIRDPARPVKSGALDTAGSAYDVVVAGKYAYLADGENGLLVISIANPSRPFSVGHYLLPQGVAEISQAVVSAGYAYIDSIRVIDVSYPQNPVEVEQLSVSFCEDIFISGEALFVADGYNGLQILDASNPLALRHSGFYATDGYSYGVAVAGDYVYLADAQDGLIIVRASQPTPTATITPTPTSTPTSTPSTPALTPTAASVYLPVAMKKYIAYFAGQREIEPNNDYHQANGPLHFDTTYSAYPNDTKDYFSFYLFEASTFSVDVFNHSGEGVQVLLYAQVPVVNGEVARVYQLPYHIEYSGKSGWYYLYIYTPEGHNNTTPYTLRIQQIPPLSMQSASAPTWQP